MFRRVLRDPGRLQAAFLGVMLALTATLAWLGWMLIDQDRQLAAQQLDNRREEVADLAVAALERTLTSWRDRLESPLSVVPRGGVVVRFTRDSIRPTPASGLIYNAASVDAEIADAAATALLDSAGREQSQKRYAAAIAAYARLEARGAAPVVGGIPAALAAQRGRLVVYERTGNTAAVVTTARALARDLDTGRWPVSYASYKYLINEARVRLPELERSSTAAEALADSVTWLWDEWSAGRLSGRWISRDTPAGPVLLIWTASQEGGRAIASGNDFVHREILGESLAKLEDANIRVSLDSPEDGRVIFGDPAANGDRAALRLALNTGLPWTVRTQAVTAADADTSTRRTLLLTGLCVLGALVLAGAWFVGRSVTRELEVARLKSDFVAAVSHEFRTPLTTIVQLSELLKRGRVATDADRQAYYDLLHVHGIRLERLIERLLNFGQVESGRAQYQQAPLDVAALTAACVAEFSEAHVTGSHTFDCSGVNQPQQVRGDREALTTALWNLLENAVKYSPDGGRIMVSLHRRADEIAISITDTGVGIPESEQRKVFEPFIRGEIARTRQIRGTGVGLALSRSIVRAHGGDITVESAPGAGSTFTISLPLDAQQGQG